MKPTNKRPPGRPAADIDWNKALELAGNGMTDGEICRALRIAHSTFMRRKSEADMIDAIQIARSQNVELVLRSMYASARKGKIGAAKFLLERLEKR